MGPFLASLLYSGGWFCHIFTPTKQSKGIFPFMLTQLKAAVLIKEDIAFRDGVCLNVITKWKKKKIKLPRNFHFIEQFVLLFSQDSTNWLEPE